MILGDIPRKEIPEETLSCWSLGALLELIPLPAIYQIMIEGVVSWGCKIWHLTQPINHIVETDTPIKAAYSMIVWLLENDYIEK